MPAKTTSANECDDISVAVERERGTRQRNNEGQLGGVQRKVTLEEGEGLGAT